MTKSLPPAPEPYESFVSRYPKLGQAWELISEAGRQGPLDAKTTRLVRLAVAIGAMRQGAVVANARKALASGISAEEVEQVVALAAATIGMPGTVAVHTWVREATAEGAKK